MGYQLLAAALGIAALHGVYRLIEGGWPDSYYALSDLASFRKSSQPLRYAVFRAGPVFAVAVFISVSLERGGEPVWPATLTAVGGHVVMTHGRAIWRLFPNTIDPRRSPLIARHVATGIAVIALGVAAVAVRGSLSDLIPPLDALAGEIWGAAAAGAIGAYLISITRSEAVDDLEIAQAAYLRVPVGLIDLARAEAQAHDTDPDLVEAVLLTEELQRPRWFRRLERLKSWVFKDGTYGIMQVKNHGWLSDEESIRRAVAGPLAGLRVPTEMTESGYDYVDYRELKDQMAPYNRSATWNRSLHTMLEFVRNR